MAKRGRPRKNTVETKMVNALDQLASYEEFVSEVLPVLRKALKEGAQASDIYEKFQAYAAARAVTIAAREQDSGKALSAIKDILDRTAGKAVERRETTHKLDSLPEEQLDALIQSKLAEAEAFEETPDQAEDDASDSPRH